MEGKKFSTKVIWYYEQSTIFFNCALPLGCVQAVILIVMKVTCKLFGQNNNNNNNKNNNSKSHIMYTRTELCE